MPIEIFLSLLSAFFVGTSDFLAKMRPANRHVLNSLLSMGVFGTLLCAVYAIFNHHNIFQFTDYYTLLLLIISGVANIIALLFLYVGLDRGPVSVVSPLATLSAVFLAIKWFLMGITLSFYGYCGGVIAVLGAIILGFKFKADIYSRHHILISAGFGVVAGFFFSLRLFIMQLISYDIHHSVVLTQTRFFGLVLTLIIIGYYHFFKHQTILPTRKDFTFKSDMMYPFLQASTGVVGIILLLIASVGAYTVIAPTIFSINAAFTVLWSAIIFKEKINCQRIIAFAIMIIGIIILKTTTQ